MYSTIKRFLPESITVNRKTERTKDLLAKTILIGTFDARVEDITINRTGVDGVTYAEPSKRAFIAEIDNTVSVGDAVTLPDGEKREVTAVGTGTVVGDYRYVEITL